MNDERADDSEEERTVTMAEAVVLRVHEVENGGVQAWVDKDAYSVTACKAAVGSDATRILAEIKLACRAEMFR